MPCQKKRIPTVKICTGDLKHKITIQTRQLGGVSVGTYTPQETFTTLASPWAGIETPNGRSRFLGTNINEKTTHVFIVRYQSTIAELEVHNNFILYDSRRFKILSVTNTNEDNNFLAIEATERGDDDKDASDA